MNEGVFVLSEIAVVQAILPVATHFSVAWSVCLSVIFMDPA